MELWIVHKQQGGFAREDPNETYVIGVYSEHELANRIALTQCAKLEKITLNFIHPGHLNTLSFFYGEEYVSHVQDKAR